MKSPTGNAGEFHLIQIIMPKYKLSSNELCDNYNEALNGKWLYTVYDNIKYEYQDQKASDNYNATFEELFPNLHKLNQDDEYHEFLFMERTLNNK